MLRIVPKPSPALAALGDHIDLATVTALLPTLVRLREVMDTARD